MKQSLISEMENILISLEPKHAQNILNGSKLVELRRRTMHVTPGTTMWMYVKLPIGSIIGKVRIKDAKHGTPKALWKDFGAVSGISKNEFFSYFNGVNFGVALILSDATRLEREIALDELREQNNRFHPPQFFTRLQAGHPILSASINNLEKSWNS